jgi:hypothetical protein
MYKTDLMSPARILLQCLGVVCFALNIAQAAAPEFPPKYQQIQLEETELAQLKSTILQLRPNATIVLVSAERQVSPGEPFNLASFETSVHETGTNFKRHGAGWCTQRTGSWQCESHDVLRRDDGVFLHVQMDIASIIALQALDFVLHESRKELFKGLLRISRTKEKDYVIHTSRNWCTHFRYITLKESGFELADPAVSGSACA